MSLIEKAVERLEGLKTKPHGSLGASESLGGQRESLGFPSSTEAKAAEAVGTLNEVSIDLSRLAKAGFVTPDDPKTLTAEEFRVLKRPLLTNIASPAAPIRNANLIMVTSSLPGEGKSFTAINLAISIAMELDKTVLLVDADVARPSVPRVLDLPESKGLMDIIQDKTLRLNEVLLKTNVEKLSILTAGTRDRHSTEVLASEGMGRLLDEMSRRYSDRIIVFDSPPLLMTTEARVLATRMGQVVFVVRAEETPKAAVKEALATIDSCPVRLMVLNQCRNVERVAYGYDYGYGY
jgi:protein-tyrosine kinase